MRIFCIGGFTTGLVILIVFWNDYTNKIPMLIWVGSIGVYLLFDLLKLIWNHIKEVARW